MQIAKAKVVCIIDDNGIYIGYVESGFDNGCGQQDIIFSFNKIEHAFFKQPSFHLAMDNSDPHIRHKAFQHMFHIQNILHPVMHEEYLSAPGYLIKDGISDDFFIE